MKNRIEKALLKTQLRRNLDKALLTSNTKRMKIVGQTPEWEEWRSSARAIKERILSNWDVHLETFADTARENGITVHWATDALEARQTVYNIAEANGANQVVKSKSMLSEEVDLNPHLEAKGIEVVETDLGEFVAQIAGERPSHIVAPIIHKSKSEVVDLYVEKLGAPRLETAEEITAYTRKLLREKFLAADVGITGANFGLVEEGAVAIVENEGNVRLCSTLPRIHIILMGIERLIPSTRELPIFLKLLAMSATGQYITNYVSLVRSPKLVEEIDGPEEVHLILVDNGRTRIYDDPRLREILFCIRCGACLNICPVYQRIGGHPYGWTYPGPLGSILTPLLNGSPAFFELPFLSTLCGRCRETCPVKIELEHLLIRLRRKAVEENGTGGIIERLIFRLYAFAASRPGVYRNLERLVRIPLAVARFLGRGGGSSLTAFPPPSPRSFHRMWRQRGGGTG